MPKTIEKSYEGQIIGGIFANEDDAEKAVEAFEDMDISSDDIEVIVQLEGDQTEEVYTDILSDRGFSDSEVSDPAPIIDVFDKFKAEYNPNGSRNLREDVAGMTAGAAVGAVAGGVAGAVIGGPVGAAAGAAAGAVVGGGAGAAAGKAVEHKK